MCKRTHLYVWRDASEAVGLACRGWENRKGGQEDISNLKKFTSTFFGSTDDVTDLFCMVEGRGVLKSLDTRACIVNGVCIQGTVGFTRNHRGARSPA